MTFPGGAPGGFPGQQPQQGPGYGPPAGGSKLAMPQFLHLGTAALGVINLFVAFANLADVGDSDEGAQFYDFQVNVGWIPIMLLVAGLLSLTFLLPGENKKPGLLPPLFSLGATLGLLFGVFTTSKAFELGAGGIMVMIFSIIQTIVAVVAYLFDAGIIKAPQQNAYGQQQFGAPQTGQFGGPQQPGQFGQQPPPPAPGQQTTYAPQQGQFGQQPPGTPPGGFGGQA
jgi:uncharacterized protein DUF5336